MFTIGIFNFNIDSTSDNRNYVIDANAIFDALKQTKILEAEHEQQYQLTAIILHWKRLSRVQLAVQHYVSTKYFKEIIIWNNNPEINLTLNEISTNNQSNGLIRIINSYVNMYDEAKYQACAEAKTLVCFYADDDWNTSHYIKTLIASFRSDPNVLHSVTNVVTYYNNLLWTFMDSRIDLHTGFSWIGCGSLFLREHAQRHLQLLRMHLQTNPELLAFSDLFFSIWLNDIPSQLIVDLVSSPTHINETDMAFSSKKDFYSLQHTSSVLAIRKLEYSLRLNQLTMNVGFPRKQNRRFPYSTRSPSSKDDFIFYSNVLPVDIENIPFDITLDPDRATYRNVPHGPNYTHFVNYNTLKAVDNDEQTCWRPNGFVKKGDFFAIDFLRIQSHIVFSLIIGHSERLQSSLKMQVSFDGIWWISHRSFKRIFMNGNRMSVTSFQRFVIDSRQFPSELQSFRYVTFNATQSSNEPFQVCDVQIINSFNINRK
ncbi:unnamed protein product [Rotaria socialis]|uniref:F5/8 type C domain-containing protein n=1 Tax=Rotaria socialis TaxID=392032 RepID=A0A818WGE1_9BILA|nr:unnamed protein product [Rotaria socialis]CAF4771085.1 unnamed protein product [Rotaria socialis]